MPCEIGPLVEGQVGDHGACAVRGRHGPGRRSLPRPRGRSASCSEATSRAMRVQRVGDAAAMAAGMQVLAGAADRELERREAAARDGDRRLVRPPHRAVGREHEIGRQAARHARATNGLEMRAADLLLALDQELDVDRQAARRRARRPRRPRSGSASAPCRRRRRAHRAGRRAPSARRAGCSMLERIGRLHVVVAVDQDRRRARRAEPLAVHDRMAAGRHRSRHCSSPAAQPLGDPGRPPRACPRRRPDRC